MSKVSYPQIPQTTDLLNLWMQNVQNLDAEPVDKVCWPYVIKKQRYFEKYNQSTKET